MKLQYYKDTDSLYIDLTSKPSVESREIAEGIVVDFDADGSVSGLRDKSIGFYTLHLKTP